MGQEHAQAEAPGWTGPIDARVARRLPLVALALAAVVSFALLIAWDSHLTFIADDWALLVRRQGWGASYFFEPFHGSNIVGLAFAYKLLREVFGLGSATPYYVASIATFVVSGALLFVYLRRRVDEWLAVAAAILVLFLGAAFEDLLFAFQLGYFASVAAGLGMLIALDREDERGDWIACGLLAVSLAFASVGLAFAVGALVDLALGRRPRARRIHVAILPIALYGLWWAGWGHTGESHVSVHNLLTAPAFVFKAAAAGVTSLLGLATGDGSEPSQPHLIWGKLVVLGGLALLGIRIVRERRMPRGLALALAIGLAFWLVMAINRDLSRLPTSSRYQYPSAVFLLLIAAEGLRGLRIPRAAIAAAVVLTGFAVAGGISLMHREYETRWLPYADSLRSRLAAVEIAGDHADPAFQIAFPPDLTAPARTYLAASARYGSPAFGEAELEGRPQPEREAADVVIAQALGLALVEPRAGERTLACQSLKASSGGYTGVTLLHGGFTLASRSSGPVEVALGRFADGFGVHFGSLEAGAKAALSIPVDESSRPWSLGLVGYGPVRLCTTEEPGAE